LLAASFIRGFLYQLRQLGDIGRDPQRLITRQQLRRRAPAGLFLVIDLGQLLSGAVCHDEGSIDVLDGPRRREAASWGEQLAS
jgi:hypothetical protein